MLSILLLHVITSRTLPAAYCCCCRLLRLLLTYGAELVLSRNKCTLTFDALFKSRIELES